MTDTADSKPYLCSKCGGAMPTPDEETARLLRLGVVDVSRVSHDVCPGESVSAAPAGRRFEARVSVVEIIPNPYVGQVNPLTGMPHREDSYDVIAQFAAHTTAPSTTAAMAAGGDLAHALGQKWMEHAEHIHLADMPVEDS